MQCHFFVQKEPDEASFEQFCLQMIRHAYEKQSSTFVAVDDYTQMAHWDRMLWEDPSSFLPHDVFPSTIPCPVLIGLATQPIEQQFDEVINLSSTPISLSTTSVIECIRADEPAKLSGREKFRYYQSRSARLATDFF